MNTKVFNLISEVKKITFLVQNELCERKFTLNNNVCNSKQKRKHDKCQCEWKELVDWISYEHDYIWNLSTCHCMWHETCKIGMYLDIKNCWFKKRLFNKLVLVEYLSLLVI